LVESLSSTLQCPLDTHLNGHPSQSNGSRFAANHGAKLLSSEDPYGNHTMGQEPNYLILTEVKLLLKNNVAVCTISIKFLLYKGNSNICYHFIYIVDKENHVQLILFISLSNIQA
jgi:hypothetical protein